MQASFFIYLWGTSTYTQVPSMTMRSMGEPAQICLDFLHCSAAMEERFFLLF